ncbi:oligosaccharide flippase family protein [Polaromonas sp.]|uniref:oligosaccharide flippase family protein n=1 Tax=Polaromonas sp. TaxID=1869339 RepID=UPI001852F961|nr:oligosaccharide flippase family protein [Polaromonas sp.]NML86826.1 oligosaccharide flippase family protein [Polaromonas sp.]
MFLKRNILASYVSQTYVTLMSILMLPLYLKYMGAEAYGLVAFFVLLQAWFQLLDMGLVSTMARQTALFGGGSVTALSFRRLLRSLEGIFLCVAFLGATLLALGAGSVAEHWLRVEHLPKEEVINAIQIMALIAVLRWMGELYRGVITGFERMVWLGAFSSVVATVRFVLVIPFFIWVGSTPTEFFTFQLIVAVLEALVLMRKAYVLLPAAPGSVTGWSWQPLRDVLGFSTTMALASVVWVVVSQTDKLLLSSLLPLADYGWFSLAVLAAGGVLLLTGPIAAALMPRLTALHGQGNDDALLTLYHQATQWAGLLVWPACFVLAWYAEQVLWVWTGNTELAVQAAPTLRLYALGNAAMALGAFPYYLQFARGKLRLHLLGTGVFVLMLLPCLFWAVGRYGALGAGWTWLAVNLVYLALWVPLVHARQARGLHGRWLRHDVAPIALRAMGGALACQWLPWPADRLLVGLQLLVISLFVLLAGAMGSSSLRAEMRHFWRRRYLQRQA